MVNKLSAYKIYLSFSDINVMCFSLTATVMILYHIENVHLNTLQLILVGTTLETACFIFEIPTGIVADVYSRKLSIVIGVVLTGLGFILEGSISSFIFVLAAQILWGLGLTFISGSLMIFSVFLGINMPENNFKPAAPDDLNTFKKMRYTFRSGLKFISSSVILPSQKPPGVFMSEANLLQKKNAEQP